MPPETPVEHLKNIGPAMGAWLRGVGVETQGELARLGPVFAYLLMRHRFPEAGINRLALYALHGAMTGEALFDLSDETRTALTAELSTATLAASFPGAPSALTSRV